MQNPSNPYDTIEDDYPNFQDDYRPPSAQPSLAQDFIKKPMKTVNDLSLPMKIHLGASVVICIVCFLAWHYTTKVFNPWIPGGLWWWVFPIFFFALTLVAHWHYESQEYWRGAVIDATIFSLLLFVINMLTLEQTLWFLWPCGVILMAMLAIHYWRFSSEPWTTALLYEFVIINVVAFLQWLSTPFTFPYWIPIFFCTAIPISIVALRYKYHEFRLWVYACVAVVHLALMTFFVWGMIFSTRFPWFLGVWIPAGAVIGFCWWTYGRQGGGEVYSVVTDDTVLSPPSQRAMGIDPESTVISFSYQNDPTAFVAPQSFNDPSTAYVQPTTFQPTSSYTTPGAYEQL